MLGLINSNLKDNLKVHYLFLVTQCLLCNAILLLGFSNFVNFLYYQKLNETVFNQTGSYIFMSFVFLIFSILFCFLNLRFKARWDFLKLSMAEKRLLRLGYYSATYIKPTIPIKNNSNLGSMSYHKAIVQVDKDIDLMISNGRILLEKEGKPSSRFYVFTERESRLKVVTFNDYEFKDLAE